MTLDHFRACVANGALPDTVGAHVRALWHDARGDWDTAHRIVQALDDAEAAWVHAYLHRKEGDAGNAAYWYARAGRAVAHGALDEEWTRIVTALLVPEP